jgi:sugar (pentulose or hexulose) kinase
MNTRTTEVIIGVDVGTTAVKVAAFAVNGAAAELPRALREYPLEQPQPGWQVQEPTIVLRPSIAQSLTALLNCAMPKCWRSRSTLPCMV